MLWRGARLTRDTARRRTAQSENLQRPCDPGHGALVSIQEVREDANPHSGSSHLFNEQVNEARIDDAASDGLPRARAYFGTAISPNHRSMVSRVTPQGAFRLFGNIPKRRLGRRYGHGE